MTSWAFIIEETYKQKNDIDFWRGELKSELGVAKIDRDEDEIRDIRKQIKDLRTKYKALV